MRNTQLQFMAIAISKTIITFYENNSTTPPIFFNIMRLLIKYFSLPLQR